jgi:LL-diaminopimelate aminotransferase
MRPAEHLEKVPEYMFALLDEKVNEKRKEGIDIITFGVGDPDLPTPDFIVDELCASVREGETHYSSSEGEDFFREAVANWYKVRFGVDLDPEREVVALIGSKEGLVDIARAFVNPGDRVIVPDPAYPVYRYGATALCRGVPVEMPLTEDNGFLIDLDSIYKGEKAKMMFFNYPNNPTGAVADEKFLKEVSEFGKEEGLIVCHDNAYSEITYDHVAPSFLQFSRDGVEFHSCSKTFNMTGFRIGFAVGGEEAISALKRLKSQVDSGPPVFIQRACAAALGSYRSAQKPACVSQVLRTYRERRDLLVRGLNDLGVKCQRPKGTFYVWARVGNSMEFSSKLLDVGIVVTPGTSFGEHGEGYVRFSLTIPVERIKEALERMEDLL